MQPKQPEEVRRDVVPHALLKAAELIGGLTALQVYLNVDRAQLFGWIVGKGTPPEVRSSAWWRFSSTRARPRMPPSPIDGSVGSPGRATNRRRLNQALAGAKASLET